MHLHCMAYVHGWPGWVSVRQLAAIQAVPVMPAMPAATALWFTVGIAVLLAGMAACTCVLCAWFFLILSTGLDVRLACYHGYACAYPCMTQLCYLATHI